MFIQCGVLHLQIANRIIPAYNSFASLANPTKMNAGMIKYKPNTADGLTYCGGSRLTTHPCKVAMTTPVVTNIFA